MQRHGTGYVAFAYDVGRQVSITPFCADGHVKYGLIIARKVFFLPCTVPQTPQQATEMANAAVEAVIAYRRRTSAELPAWVGTFVFGSELALKQKADSLRGQLVTMDAQIDSYTGYKGVLAYQSQTLVEMVSKLLDHFCGIHLTIDDKYVEDASIRTDLARPRRSLKSRVSRVTSSEITSTKSTATESGSIFPKTCPVFSS